MYNGVRAIASDVQDKYHELSSMISGAGTGRQPNGYGGAYNSGDDDLVYSGSRPLQRPNAGYADQELYRQRYDEIANNSPAKTMEEINALL